jgi:Mor family transcriptional regulator
MSKRKFLIFVSTCTDLIKRELIASLGISESKAEEAAREATHAVCSVFAKQNVYIPENRQVELSKRDCELWECFTGSNIEELGVKFDLSSVQVYKIVERMRQAAKARQEPRLPGF